MELVYSASRDRPRWSELPDRELLLAVRDGDESAFDELIGRKLQPLLSATRRMVANEEDARDIVQAAFLRIWENRERYDDRYSPNTWIYRIATNLAIDYLRSSRSRTQVAEPVRHHLRQVADGRAHRELSGLQGPEVDGIFRELVSELPERQRAVFVLREIEDLSTREVAEILGCRESTVRNHLFNARKVLRRELVARYPEYVPAHFEGRRGDGRDLS